jgi:MFS family permease
VSARFLAAGRATFSALAVPNYRRYISGQAISLIGTWMQMTAQAWLVLTLTGSSTMLGLIVALQTLPVLVLGPYGGVIADRVDKRALMVALQAAMGVQALILGVLTVTHLVTVWEIGVLAVLLGFNNAFENPARQSFMSEMVGADHLRNAVSLNSVLVNVARSVGPALAGLLIATVGEGVCFLANAASFLAVDLLADTPRSRRAHAEPAHRFASAGQLREGLRYVAARRRSLVPLLMMALVGCLGLRVPGLAAGDGALGAARGRDGLRLHDLGDGQSVRSRRARRRLARDDGCANADAHRHCVRRDLCARRIGTEPPARAGRACDARLGEHLVHGDRQLDAPADR